MYYKIVVRFDHLFADTKFRFDIYYHHGHIHIIHCIHQIVHHGRGAIGQC